MLEIDNDVSKKLEETAKQLGITRNGVLRQLLKLDKPVVVSHIKKGASKRGKNQHQSFKNIQDELIPHIVRILYKNGGKATKTVVENAIFALFQSEFEKPYYNETVSHGVPRWKHHIAWAKERAKQIQGLIKSANESGRGIWELTDKGITYYKNNH